MTPYYVQVENALVVAAPTSVVAQVAGCRPPGDNTGYTAGYVGSDGKRHIRVGTSGSVAPEMANGMDAAMAVWNARSGTTNVVFEWGSPVDFGLRQTTDPNLHGGCITQPRSNIWINYSHDGCYLAALDYPTQMALALEHEIGHFLGMEHNTTDPTSGMAPCAGDASCHDCLLNSKPMHSGDLAKVAQCLSQQEAEFDGGSYEDCEEESTYYEDGLVEVCEYWWLVTTTYSCTSSGCETDVTVELVDEDCYSYYL